MFVIPNIPEPLSRAIYADLLKHLPSPAEDTAEARAVRDERAVTAVAHLLPENAAEAEVAVLIVGAQCHARDALRSAVAYAGIDPAEVRRCRAQAASMMRQADSGIRTLMRLQAERHKAEDALRPFAMQRAGHWWKEVSAPAPDRPREGGDPGPAPGPEAPPQSSARPAAEPDKRPTSADIEADVKLYAAMYPDRVRRIRAAGGLPADLDFGPPEPEIVNALLRGSNGAHAVPHDET